MTVREVAVSFGVGIWPASICVGSADSRHRYRVQQSKGVADVVHCCGSLLRSKRGEDLCQLLAWTGADHHRSAWTTRAVDDRDLQYFGNGSAVLAGLAHRPRLVLGFAGRRQGKGHT